MAVDPDQIAAIARTTVDLYRTAEWALLQLVTRSLRQGLDGPMWAIERMAAVGDLRRAAQAIVEQLGADAAETITQAVAEAYREGTAATLTDLPDDLAVRLAAQEATAVVTRAGAVESLATALITDIGERYSNVLRHVMDVYRLVIAQATAASIAGGLTRRQAAQHAYGRLVDQGVTSFTDRRGRRWRLSSYVEMAVRTVTQRAAVQGQTDRQQRLRLPFVTISDHVQECERCRPYQGRVLRVDAGPVGTVRAVNPATGDTVTVQVVATLDDARSKGLFHPNCRCAARTYLPGVTRLPQQPTGDPDGDKARQRQRAIERQIRRWKERDAAALDPVARRAAKGKVRQWQSELRSHLAANPSLKRLAYREQIGAGNTP